MMQKFSKSIRKGWLSSPSNFSSLNILDTFAMMQFSSGKLVYGGLRDQDRIFTNLYKDGDVGIQGAMKRVHTINHDLYRAIGTEPRIS